MVCLLKDTSGVEVVMVVMKMMKADRLHTRHYIDVTAVRNNNSYWVLVMGRTGWRPCNEGDGCGVRRCDAQRLRRGREHYVRLSVKIVQPLESPKGQGARVMND